MGNIKFDTGTVIEIESGADLRDLAEHFGLRPDWHETDESGINAEIIGTHLNNAFGSDANPRMDGRHEHGEFNVILTHNYKDVAVVNLANLLAMAAGTF